MIRRAAGLLFLLAAAGCMRAPGGSAPGGGAAAAGAPRADSMTVALWRFEDTAGDEVRDAGPYRLTGTSGISTRPAFGRYGSCREFVRDADSFVFVPYSASLQPGRALTVEAWVYPVAWGQYEDTPIVSLWSEEPQQKSWLLSIAGERRVPPLVSLASPGFHLDLVSPNREGHLMFAFQPADANVAQSYLSTEPLKLGRWTHVAATYDGEIVKLWIDGRLDAQFASRGRIRPTSAPVLMGNAFDVRRLSTFGGSLRLDPGADRNPYYAFQGSIDEVRLSSIVREDFPSIVGR